MVDIATVNGSMGGSPAISGRNEKIPLVRSEITPEIFPFQKMGKNMSLAVFDLSDALQVPFELVAQSMLSSAAFLCQGQFDVLAVSKKMPTSLFCASIAQSGGGKSSSEKIVMSAIREAESARLAEWCKSQPTSGIPVTNRFGSPRQEIRRFPIRLMQDVTYEGLVTHLEAGEPSVLQTSDESAEFFGGWSMSREHQSRTVAGYCRLWEADPVTRSRKGDGTIRMDGKRLSVNFLMQESVAENLLCNPSLTDQGWPARFLCCKPNIRPGMRKFVGLDPLQINSVVSLHERHRELLERPLSVHRDMPHAIFPKLLVFDDDAQSVFEDIFYHFEEGQRVGEKYESIRSFASKGIYHTARIAAVIHHMDSDSSIIASQTLRDAFCLSKWFASEAARIWGVTTTPKRLVQAKALLDWLTRRKLKTVKLQEIYQNGPNALRSAHHARYIASVLVEHGYLEPNISTNTQGHGPTSWRVC